MSSRTILMGLIALLCLTVAPAFGSSVVYDFPLDSDPGWTRDSEWGFMSGSDCGDPGDCGVPSAHTGSYYFDISPGTTYPTDMGTQYLSTTAMDCSGLSEVYLRFWRWLGMAGNTYSAVWVSNDGTTWYDVWTHATADGSDWLTDDEWTECVYDISSVAAGQSTVYVRWVMTRNPGVGCSGTCWGFAIDDIQILSGESATQVLAWIPYADLSREYPNTLAALSSKYSSYDVTESSTTDPATLASELQGKHVFLMPEPENADFEDLYTTAEAFSEVLQNFVTAGGTVIAAGQNCCYKSFLEGAGLMNVSVVGAYASNDMTIFAPEHPLVDGVTGPIPAQDATFTSEVGPEAVVVVEGPDGNAAVAARQMGAGAVVLLGYDYYDYDDNAAQILANAVQYPRKSTNVLLYDDWTTRVGLEALTRLDYDPALAGDADFNTALGSGFWNAVVADVPNISPQETGGWQPFIDWINSGGIAVVSTWNLQGQTALADALGVTAGANGLGVPDLYDWDNGPPLFDFREAVPSPIADWADGTFGTDYNELTVASGNAMALAGFAADDSAGHAAVVMGNDSRTLVNGFLWAAQNQDADADGIQDVVELAMNEIAMALCVPIGTIEAAPTEIVTGESVDFSAEVNASVTGGEWNFGDGATDTSSETPTHQYDTPGIYDVWLHLDNRNGRSTAVEEDLIWVGFPDTPPDFWAFHDILRCVDAGAVQGFADGSYSPAIAVTRAQMAVYIARALAGGDAYVPDPGCTDPIFTDVDCDYWARKYIQYAVAESVVNGYEDGSYQPDLELDRGQMAVFIARAIAGDDASVPAGPDTPTFPDVATDFWSYKHIEYCKSAGVVGGYEDGMYHPEYVVTRDLMAVFVNRTLPLLEFD